MAVFGLVGTCVVPLPLVLSSLPSLFVPAVSGIVGLGLCLL